jgi:hypothetical protein
MTITAKFNWSGFDAPKGTEDFALQGRDGERVTLNADVADDHDTDEPVPVTFESGYQNIVFLDELTEWRLS